MSKDILDIVDELKTGSESLGVISEYLINLRKAFYITGNSEMGSTMGGLAERVSDIESLLISISAAYVEELSRLSVESSNNVLQSALAGIAVGRKDMDGYKKTQ